jgi:histone H3/H4
MPRMKIVRDSIYGITKPAIARLARKAGVKRISSFIYEETRGQMKIFLENVLRQAVMNVDFHSRSTVLSQDIENGLPVKMFSEDMKKKLCKVKSVTRKRASGVKSIDEIRHYQGCEYLILPRLSFARFVREVAQDFKTDLRFSTDAITVLQYAVENYVIEMLEDANLAAIHAKRTTIQPKDIQLASRIAGDNVVNNPGPMPPSKVKVHQTFDLYIKAVLKQVHPALRISKDSVSQINFIVNQLTAKIGLAAKGMMTSEKTITVKMIKVAVNLSLPGELARHGTGEGTKAVTNFANSSKSGKKTDRSGLKVPPSRIHRIIADTCKQRIGTTASIYCAAVVEYIIAEILELAGSRTTQETRKVISSGDLFMAINHDEELHKLVKNNLNIEILTGSVIPNIHSILLPKNK